MNVSLIFFILSNVLIAEGAFMIFPVITAAIHGEQALLSYLIVSILSILFGFLGRRRKPKNNIFYLKDGCVATALSWILLSLVGCIPVMTSGDIPRFVDAFFEITSGFTTTGSSILTDVESLSFATKMWRSTTHWFGGMGILVFLLAIIPLSGGSNINLMRAESPGPSVSKLMPKMKQSAGILYLIYFVLTLIELILLLFGGMTFFEALTMTFGTAGTGGFGIYNSSCADFTPYCQWVIAIFMFLFGINFNFYFYLLFRQAKRAFTIEEVWVYVAIVACSVLVLYLNTRSMYVSSDALRHSVFQVTAIISSTGYATADFNVWNNTARAWLVGLMFIGACAGSTGGGLKVSRMIILFKSMIREFKHFAHPKSIVKIKMDNKTIEEEAIHSVQTYIVVFLFVFIISFALLSFENHDLETNFTAVTTTMNNIGPGLSLVGPTGNFSVFSDFSKVVLIFDMLAGRLELYPLLLLFYPTIWRDLFKDIKKRKQ